MHCNCLAPRPLWQSQYPKQGIYKGTLYHPPNLALGWFGYWTKLPNPIIKVPKSLIVNPDTKFAFLTPMTSNAHPTLLNEKPRSEGQKNIFRTLHCRFLATPTLRLADCSFLCALKKIENRLEKNHLRKTRKNLRQTRPKNLSLTSNLHIPILPHLPFDFAPPEIVQAKNKSLTCSSIMRGSFSLVRWSFRHRFLDL